METWVGTSGYNYPEWKGSFYPPALAASKMLPYYAERFRTVEINYTFYRMPNAKVLAGWMAQTPPGFRFTLKAPKRITHDRRLKDVGELVTGFCELAGGLGDRLATLLFQLPPNLKCQPEVFDAFLETLPPKVHRGLRVPARVVARRRRSSSACGRGTWRCASPIPATARRRSSRPPTTATCGCATRATSPPISNAGLRCSPRAATAGARRSCISSTRRRARGREFAQALHGDSRACAMPRRDPRQDERQRGVLGPVAVVAVAIVAHERAVTTVAGDDGGHLRIAGHLGPAELVAAARTGRCRTPGSAPAPRCDRRRASRWRDGSSRWRRGSHGAARCRPRRTGGPCGRCASGRQIVAARPGRRLAPHARLQVAHEVPLIRDVRPALECRDAVARDPSSGRRRTPPSAPAAPRRRSHQRA